MSKLDCTTISKEISYNALKQGHGMVSWIKKSDNITTGFDMISIEGQRKEIIGVKATEKDDNFVISNAELKFMSEPKDTKYLIHRYKFNNGRVQSFNIYTFNKDKNILVDIVDKNSICTIEPHVLNKNGSQVIVYDCKPTKVKKNI